jgi:hypothetical protein
MEHPPPKEVGKHQNGLFSSNQVRHTMGVKGEEIPNPIDSTQDFQLLIDKYKTCLRPLEKPQDSPVVQSFQTRRIMLCLHRLNVVFAKAGVLKHWIYLSSAVLEDGIVASGEKRSPARADRLHGLAQDVLKFCESVVEA